MLLQYEENPNTWSSCWKETSSNGTRQDKSSQEVEDANRNQGSRKLSGICKFL